MDGAACRVARWFTYKLKLLILEGLGMENFAINYVHSEYLKAIWYTLWPFGIFCGHWGLFSPVLVCFIKKIWQHGRDSL
jgi:hypothetical protein